ncbi:MAG: M20 family metallopeptidase [Candidatus Heimdallarchaeaceae archaeon]
MKITEEDVIPILKKLIAIKTENPPGKTIEAVRYLSNLFTEAGIRNRIQEYDNEKANLIVEYGEEEKTIILTGHLDTVPAGDENRWEFPPFSGEEKEGRIYGRGATDMKGAVAAFVAILLKLKENNIKLNRKIIFLGTSDEEIGMDGAVEVRKTGIMKGCEFILIGEPTELQLGIAEKGTLWFKVIVEGKSAHGSTPELGVSAIEAAAKLIFQLKNAVPDFEHKILGKSTINIGKIKGGTLINVVPEYCEFECDLRLVADNLREETKEKIAEILKRFNAEEKAKAHIEMIHEITAIELKEKTSFFKTLVEKVNQLGKEKIIGLNYGTDGAMLVPEFDTPFVIFGPGKLNQLHVTNEYTEKEEVIKYSNLVYDSIVESFS